MLSLVMVAALAQHPTAQGSPQTPTKATPPVLAPPPKSAPPVMLPPAKGTPQSVPYYGSPQTPIGAPEGEYKIKGKYHEKGKPRVGFHPLRGLMHNGAKGADCSTGQCDK